MSFDPRKMTWAALLGRWVQFARSAVALPDDAQGRAWKAIIPDIIGLQAVTCALEEIEGLPSAERALGVDRAAILIERHTGNIHRRLGPDLPARMNEMIVQATGALQRAKTASAGS